MYFHHLHTYTATYELIFKIIMEELDDKLKTINAT